MPPLSSFFRRKASAQESVEPLSSETHADRRASEVQQRLLTRLPVVPGWDLGLCYRPCDAVGGDLVDCLVMGDGRILITVGDVAGHGTQGALIAVTARRAIHALVEQVDSLANLVVNLNEDMRKDCLPGQFIAAFIAILDPASGRLVSCCAGAHSALLVDPEGPVHLRRLRSRGMALGVTNSEVFAKNLTLKESTITAGSTLVLYTDGVTEARCLAGLNAESQESAEEEEFGEEGVMAAVLKHCRKPAQSQVDALVAEADRFSHGRIDDDVTVLAVQRTVESSGEAPD